MIMSTFARFFRFIPNCLLEARRFGPSVPSMGFVSCGASNSYYIRQFTRDRLCPYAHRSVHFGTKRFLFYKFPAPYCSWFRISRIGSRSYPQLLSPCSKVSSSSKWVYGRLPSILPLLLLVSCPPWRLMPRMSYCRDYWCDLSVDSASLSPCSCFLLPTINLPPT